MTNIILRIISILTLACFVYTGLHFIMSTDGRKHYSAFIFAAIGLAAGCMESLLLPLPIGLAYIIAFILMYTTIYCLFNISGINNLYGTLAMLNSAMCLRGIGGSIIAASMGCSLHDVFSNTTYLLINNIISDLLCFVILLFLSKFIDRDRIILSLKPRARKTFLMGWMIGFAVLLVSNAFIFETHVDSLAFLLLEGNYCFVLMIGCYAMLIFTFQVNKGEAATKNLSKELLAQDKLQSALVQNALFIARANLTKNQIVSGLSVYSETFGKEVKYDEWLDFSKKKIHPDDLKHFINVLNRASLFECFEQGNEPDPFNYRRLGTDNEYHWVKINIRLYSDTDTGDIHIVGYAMDVDKDMKERAELQRRAQTDSLTKLLNREAAQKAIAKEITKGCGALFLMDIDNFKDVNDCMGHEIGDKVLIGVADRLKAFFGEEHIVGRLGGDEFLAYVRNINDVETLSDMAQKLVALLGRPPETPDEPTISLSVGVAPVTDGSISFANVYSQADSSLYEKKYNGKNGFLIFSDSK